MKKQLAEALILGMALQTGESPEYTGSRIKRKIELTKKQKKSKAKSKNAAKARKRNR